MQLDQIVHQQLILLELDQGARAGEGHQRVACRGAQAGHEAEARDQALVHVRQGHASVVDLNGGT